jgi:hypothetical protein
MSDKSVVEQIIKPAINKVISGTTVVTSAPIKLSSMGMATFQFNYASGLTATFQILGSLDGTTFADMLAVIQPTNGAAGTSIGSVDTGAIKWIMAQVTPTAGSALVSVLGRAVTRS